MAIMIYIIFCVVSGDDSIARLFWRVLLLQKKSASNYSGENILWRIPGSWGFRGGFVGRVQWRIPMWIRLNNHSGEDHPIRIWVGFVCVSEFWRGLWGPMFLNTFAISGYYDYVQHLITNHCRIAYRSSSYRQVIGEESVLEQIFGIANNITENRTTKPLGQTHRRWKQTGATGLPRGRNNRYWSLPWFAMINSYVVPEIIQRGGGIPCAEKLASVWSDRVLIFPPRRRPNNKIKNEWCEGPVCLIQMARTTN